MMKKLLFVLALTLMASTAFAGAKDEIGNTILSEYSKCTKVVYFDTLSMMPTGFSVENIESLTIKDGILEIKGKVVKDKSRWIRKSVDQLNLVWLQTDKKKAKTTMTIAFTGYAEPLPNAEALMAMLDTEYKAANNKVTLWGMIKLPIIVDKVNSKVKEFSIKDGALTIKTDGEKAATTIITSLNGLQQVTVKENKKNATKNVIALFQ